jgi:subtilisin family serine protease
LSLDLLKSDGYNPSSTLSINGNNLVNENYSFISGTSFSAPTVSGVIALMLSENQNLTFDEIRNILITTTQQVGLENQADYSVNNFDTKRAYGKIDATKAIEGAIDAL